jgi:hypothetical protein
MTTTHQTRAGRRWAYIGAALGGTVSIAANVAHSYVPPQGASQDWSPKVGAVIGAMFWPVALFVATEILTRVAWPSGRVWQLLRWAGMLPVAAVAALVSYRHLSGLLAFYGEEPIACVLGPLAVDGLMVMATGAILATGQHHDVTPTSAPAVPDNAVRPAPTLRAVPAPPTPVPAVATPAPTPEPNVSPEPAPATPIPTPAHVAARVIPSPTTLPLRSTTVPAPSAGTPKPTGKPVSTAPAVKLAAPATNISVAVPEPAQPALPLPVEPGLLARADQVARQYRTEHGMPITAGQLAARLRVNSEQAAQALAVLDLGPNPPTAKIPAVNGTPVKATR